MHGVTKEHAERRFVEQFEKFERIVDVVEQETGEPWADIRACRGGRLRNLVFYLARQRSGLTLQEIGNRTNFDYKLVGKAAGNFGVLIRKDNALRALTDRCMTALAKSEM